MRKDILALLALLAMPVMAVADEAGEGDSVTQEMCAAGGTGGSAEEGGSELTESQQQACRVQWPNLTGNSSGSVDSATANPDSLTPATASAPGTTSGNEAAAATGLSVPAQEPAPVTITAQDTAGAVPLTDEQTALNRSLLKAEDDLSADTPNAAVQRALTDPNVARINDAGQPVDVNGNVIAGNETGNSLVQPANATTGTGTTPDATTSSGARTPEMLTSQNDERTQPAATTNCAAGSAGCQNVPTSDEASRAARTPEMLTTPNDERTQPTATTNCAPGSAGCQNVPTREEATRTPNAAPPAAPTAAPTRTPTAAPTRTPGADNTTTPNAQQQAAAQQALQKALQGLGAQQAASAAQQAAAQQAAAAAQTACTGANSAYNSSYYNPYALQQQYAYGTTGTYNPYAATATCNPYLNTAQTAQQMQQQQAQQWQTGYTAGVASCQTTTGTTTQPLNPYLAQDPAYLDGYTAGQKACQAQTALSSACATGTSTAECKRAAGYLDGSRTGTGGTCGIGMDPRYSSDVDYKAGYNDGVTVCGKNGGKVTTTTVPSTTLAGIPADSPVKDASDARVRKECMENFSKLDLGKFDMSLLKIAFKADTERSVAEREKFGFDKTAEEKAVRFKGGFDVGKRDALYSFGNDPNSGDPFYVKGYYEGYSCGQKFISLDKAN